MGQKTRAEIDALRAEREHAEAISKLVRPALESMPEPLCRAAVQPGTDLYFVLRAFSEMLLPLQRQIDQLEAREAATERELDRQIDGLRARIEALS